MADASSTHTEKAYAWGGEAPPSASVKVPIALPGLSGTAGRRYTPYSCLHRPLAEAAVSAAPPGRSEAVILEKTESCQRLLDTNLEHGLVGKDLYIVI